MRIPRVVEIKEVTGVAEVNELLSKGWRMIDNAPIQGKFVYVLGRYEVTSLCAEDDQLHSKC